MTRYLAFLRGVTPQNVRNADLRQALEAAGFTGVRTILASGNLAFDAVDAPVDALAGRIESILAEAVGRRFPVIVRRQSHLQKLLAEDPFASHAPPAGAKRVVTFLRTDQAPKRPLPFAEDNACVLAKAGLEVFTAYLPHPKGPVFMTLLEKAFGRDITTRTWDTVRKCAGA
jgi:uncharacterized protein (DUF1697 family)